MSFNFAHFNARHFADWFQVPLKGVSLPVFFQFFFLALQLWTGIFHRVVAVWYSNGHRHNLIGIYFFCVCAAGTNMRWEFSPCIFLQRSLLMWSPKNRNRQALAPPPPPPSSEGNFNRPVSVLWPAFKTQNRLPVPITLPRTRPPRVFLSVRENSLCSPRKLRRFYLFPWINNLCLLNPRIVPRSCSVVSLKWVSWQSCSIRRRI